MYKNERGSLFIRELCLSLESSFRNSENLRDTFKTVLDRCTAGESPAIIFSTFTKSFVLNVESFELKHASSKRRNFFVILKRITFILTLIWALKWYTNRLISRKVPIVIKASDILQKYLRVV